MRAQIIPIPPHFVIEIRLVTNQRRMFAVNLELLQTVLTAAGRGGP